MFFEYGIAAYDLELRGNLQNWKDLSDKDKEVFKANLNEMLGKIRKQALKDYVLHPLVSGPSFLPTLAANFTANVVRNVWSNTVIICGHFPDGIDTFETDSIDGETRGEWYLRQMLGSGNISYAEISPKIQALMAKHDLHYVTGPVLKQAYQVYRKVCRLSLPNEEPGRSRWSVVRGELAKVVRGKGEARTKRHLPSTV